MHMRAIIVLALGFMTLAEPGARAQEIVILTGGTSGVYYPVGLALKKIIESRAPNQTVKVLSTQATVENLNLLQQGKGTLALAQGDILNDAWKGNPEAGFPSSRTKIRLLSAAYPNYVHIVARKDAGIAKLRDLRGKRVSVGAARSGNELNARALLSSAGMSYADLLQVEYLEYGASVDLMAKNQLDAAIISAGLGVTAVKRAASEMPIVLIPVDVETIEKNKGMFFATTIPAGSYSGQDSEVSAAALNNYFVTSSDVPDDTVHRITKLMFENLNELHKAHPAISVLQRENAIVQRPISVHPGALNYFRESGILK
jgi:TRAP transporter TAXI family solute receptor